jgi:hypothetical protein
MSNAETMPDAANGNPFALLAYVMFKVRHALEDREETDRPPRWVRIARGREAADPAKGQIIGGLVAAGVQGMAETIAFMAQLTLEIQDQLLQTDAAKALTELALELVDAATDDDFKTGVKNLTGLDMDTLSGITDVNNSVDGIRGVLDYIPEPEDLKALGHEFYRLLCIVQHDLRDSENQIAFVPDDVDHVSQLHSGKMRLCAWAYAHELSAYTLDVQRRLSLKHFGIRRLVAMDSPSPDLPRASAMKWVDGEPEIELFSFNFNSGETTSADIEELKSLLQSYGYNDAKIETNLLKFQVVNDLPVTGELDNHTINRLLNLDFARKNLRRAKPYEERDWPWGTDPLPLSGALPLVNASGDDWEAEGLDIVTPTAKRGPHSYYLIPAKRTSEESQPKQGWIWDSTSAPQFMAIESRARNQEDEGRFRGGRWSEGEAADGRFFFAARLVSPWIDGRYEEWVGEVYQEPEDALFAPVRPAQGIARMYQWVELPDWLIKDDPRNNDPSWKLKVQASVLQRSLYSHRSASEGYPDQGRILVEFYKTAHDESGHLLSRNTTDRLEGGAETDWYPNHAGLALALALKEVDRKRHWMPRFTDSVEVPAGAKAICLVVEGKYQTEYDIDAYFDDFRLTYAWHKDENANQ